jgi:GrpB-like predicted nucleotidyltransferase (UPF0157 family)
LNRGRTIVTIADYDAAWPLLFEREAGKIQSVLGVRALRIEHVGSTSVAGLAAKPVLDIALVVADAAREADYAAPLERAGYTLHIREPGWHQHRMFQGPDLDVNLHVFSDGCSEIERMLLFRDWLRRNGADRSLYEHTKRELARKEWQRTQDYADAKTGVIEAIMARAGAERKLSPGCRLHAPQLGLS